MFTLCGGHLFSIYDGCRDEGIEVIDTRHEASAAWAAEGWAKATREVGVCALTAGPGVTNGMSAIAGAKFNRTPLVVLGGRAPEMRWGSGILQEIDHLPFVGPLVKSAAPPRTRRRLPELTSAPRSTSRWRIRPGRRSSTSRSTSSSPRPRPDGSGGAGRSTVAGRSSDEAAELLSHAERPAIMAGTGVSTRGARRGVDAKPSPRALGIPVFLNGMGRGCLPADHELCFSRARGKGLKEADVALRL